MSTHVETAMSCAKPNLPAVATAEAIDLAQLTLPEGENLLEASQKQPVLLFFVRHKGCTFCRESLTELSRHQDEVWRRGLRPYVVHMGPESTSVELKEKFKLPGIKMISDPEKRFYQAVGLRRGTLSQLFGPRVVWRGLRGILRGYGIGKLEGDGFQMGGMFLVTRGKVIQIHDPRDAADIGNLKQILQRADGYL